MERRIAKLYDELDACMRDIDRYREALHFYAESHGSGICIAPCCIDNGRRARAALKAVNEEGWDANGSPTV